MINFKKTPVELKKFNDFHIYIKRDDLTHPDFSGNKARKFYHFFKKDYPNIKKVISFGSNQSNAMYSLSVLCRLKGWKFEYYTEHIPKFLKDNPAGNLKYALENGMQIKIFKEGYPEELKDKNLLSKTILKNDIIIIPEGGRCETSKEGIYNLAKEIVDFVKEKNILNLNLFLPSGTGTTALYLQSYFKINHININVFTNACVGDDKYLSKQFHSLETNKNFHPTILQTKKEHFGKLDCKKYRFWIELYEKTGIEFDLLYDPSGFMVMLEYIKKLQSDAAIMYLHQGGLKGNKSMIQRYKRKCSENI